MISTIKLLSFRLYFGLYNYYNVIISTRFSTPDSQLCGGSASAPHPAAPGPGAPLRTNDILGGGGGGGGVQGADAPGRRTEGGRQIVAGLVVLINVYN